MWRAVLNLKCLTTPPHSSYVSNSPDVCRCFITIQRIWIVLGRCLFFKDLFIRFHDFWSQIGVVILVTPKQEVQRKSERYCGVKFLHSYFKSRVRKLFHFYFYRFFDFWIGFFLNGFRNPFIVHFFLFGAKFYFSLVVFSWHVAFWHWFCFLKFFSVCFF